MVIVIDGLAGAEPSILLIDEQKARLSLAIHVIGPCYPDRSGTNVLLLIYETAAFLCFANLCY